MGHALRSSPVNDLAKIVTWFILCRMALLGIDIGGTKTSVCLGTREGDILANRRMPTRPEEGPDAGIARILDLIDDLLTAQGLALEAVEAVGLSAPGPVNLERGVMLEPPNMKGWVHVPIVKLFSEALRKPITMNNDANACVLAEWLFGSFRGEANLVYITLSTGLGAGIIANGRLVQGASDMGGEIGHHILDIHGSPCPCGMRGCFEVYCGGKNVADRLRERIVEEEISTDILDEAGGEPDAIDFRHFVAAVEMNDGFALDMWEEYTDRLAQGIGNIIQILNPGAILLGTIAIHTGDLLMDPLLDKLNRHTWAYARQACTIAPSALGGKIGDLSALALAMEGLNAR